MTAVAIESSSTRLAEPRTAAGLILRPVRGQTDSPLIPLGIGRHVIGSGPDAEVRLQTAGVDAQHAVLLVGPQRSVLKAFSRFTWVNDGVVRECAIKPGDRICLGPVEFEVLKGKTRRQRPSASPAQAVETPRPAIGSGWATTSHLASIADMAPRTAAPSAISRRENVIGELNAELLQQLSQLVERETVAAERERRLIEQTAQVEGRRKVVEGRQSEIEQAQAELARAEAEWRRKSADVSEQAVQLRLERESLERERIRLSEESSRLANQLQELEGRRSSLAVREARLDEQAAALEQRASQLGEQERNHAVAVAQTLTASQNHADDVQRIAEQKTSLQRLEEQLRLQQVQLEDERTRYESDRDKLFAERAHLATREVEFTELRRRVQEQQAELETRERLSQGLFDQAHSQQSLALESASHLAEREQRFAEQEAALAIQRNELDQRKQELDEQHAAWMLERHTVAARGQSADEREAAQAAAVEVELLRTQVSELQARLREERRLWDMERSELSAQAAAAEPEPAHVPEPGHPENLIAEIAQLQKQLDAERTQYQQERDAWEAEQDLILRDRLALEAEWRRLEARAERGHTVDAPIKHDMYASDVVPPPIPEHFLTQTDEPAAAAEPGFEDSWDHSQVESEHSLGFDESAAADVELEATAATWDADASAFDDADQYGAQAVHNEEYENDGYETGAGFQHVEEAQAAGGGDVLSLRAQLAELFGIQASQESADPTGHSYADDSFAEEPTAELPAEQSADFTNHDHFGGSILDVSPEAQAASDKSDEDIMSAYLSRLLKKSPEEVSTLHPAPVQPELDEAAEDDSAAEQATEPQKPTRRLNAEEKVTLRANLDSFRELANQQARAAVAKHKSNELKSGMQLTSVIAVLVSVVGVILITAEFWSSQSYRMYGLACLGVAGAMGIYTLINGMKVRRLKAIERAAAELTEALHTDDEQPAAATE